MISTAHTSGTNNTIDVNSTENSRLQPHSTTKVSPQCFAPQPEMNETFKNNWEVFPTSSQHSNQYTTDENGLTKLKNLENIFNKI